MAGITDLINNITDSVQNLVNQLTGQNASSSPYPTNVAQVGSALNDINRANWNSLPKPYSFAVFNTATNSFEGTGFAEFALTINPGKLSQTEHPAIAMKSTQGGTVVSHSGNKYKSLVLSGTTGIAPFRGAGGVQRSNGTAIFQPNDIKYRSGFEVFQMLRNYFKAYYELKKNSPESKAYRLVFKNYKDGEFLIVELLDFVMDRQAPRGFLYDYNMTFKVIGKVTFSAPKSNLLAFERVLNDAVDKIDTARGVFLRSQDILRQIEGTYDQTILEPLRKASLALKAFLGIGTTAADVSNQAIKSTMTALASLNILSQVAGLKTAQANGSTAPNLVLDRVTLPHDLKAAAANNPAQAVINLGEGLTLLKPTDLPPATQLAFAEEQTTITTLPRRFFLDAYASITTIKNNSEDAFGLSSPAYDTLFGRTSTVVPDPTKEITDAEFDVLDAFDQALAGLEGLLSTNTLFKSTYSDAIAQMNAAFSNELGLQALPAVRQISMPKDTDLERLALTYLGDETRWVEIAELNNLQAPFVIQDESDTTSNVVHPNQNLLIPINPTAGFSQLPMGAEITSEQLSYFEKSLGTDLKLTKDFDLSLGSNGDLQIVSGKDNVAQAVVLKLGIEKNELLSNPTIGVGIRIGSKTPDLNEVRNDLIRTLTQDQRIDAVNNITIRQDNDSLFLVFDLILKHVDIPVPISLKVV